MNTTETTVFIVLLVIFVPVTALIWAFAISEWRDLLTMPTPHDPAVHHDILLDRWERAPAWPLRSRDEDSADGTADGVAVADIVAVTGGESSDDEGDVTAGLHLRLPGSRSAIVYVEVSGSRAVRPGMFLPVGEETWEPASNLPVATIGRMLLEHRRTLGLLDDAAIPVGQRPELADVHGIRPTGRALAGHAEVVLTLGGAYDTTVRGFLRPEEIATARHTGQVPVIRTTEGRWTLWPTWY